MNKCKVVHCKKERYDVYIGRPSKWGNPFTHIQDGKTLAKYIVGSRDEAIEAYREWIMTQEDLLNALPELKGKILGCWCVSEPITEIRDNKQCHGEILLQLILEREGKV